MDPASILNAFQKGLSVIREDKSLLFAAQQENEWFLPGLVRHAIDEMLPWFEPGNGMRFKSGIGQPRRIGIIAAGNLPLVGLHDILITLLAGHEAVVKPSSKDSRLLTALVGELPPELQAKISLVQAIRPIDIDFLLATGSDNTARHLRHAFAQTPKLIRHNRFSAAVLSGQESEAELDGLARDILLYHGMGCRSVSNVVVPFDWKPDRLQAALERFPEEWLAPAWAEVVKWENAIWKMGRRGGKTNERVVWVENEGLKPVPIAHVNIVRKAGEWEKLVEAAKEDLQCVVGGEMDVGFGQTQCPGLTDYADGENTWELLTKGLSERLVSDQ